MEEIPEYNPDPLAGSPLRRRLADAHERAKCPPPQEPASEERFLPHGTPAQRLAHNAEYLLRNERGGKLDLVPSFATVEDADTGLYKITKGLSTLSRALPAGQLACVRESFLLMRAGVEELGVWLREQGVEV